MILTKLGSIQELKLKISSFCTAHYNGPVESLRGNAEVTKFGSDLLFRVMIYLSKSFILFGKSHNGSQKVLRKNK